MQLICYALVDARAAAAIALCCSTACWQRSHHPVRAAQVKPAVKLTTCPRTLVNSGV
jgi:hypothetical protein